MRFSKRAKEKHVDHIRNCHQQCPTFALNWQHVEWRDNYSYQITSCCQYTSTSRPLATGTYGSVKSSIGSDTPICHSWRPFRPGPGHTRLMSFTKRRKLQPTGSQCLSMSLQNQYLNTHKSTHALILSTVITIQQGSVLCGGKSVPCPMGQSNRHCHMFVFVETMPTDKHTNGGAQKHCEAAEPKK